MRQLHLVRVQDDRLALEVVGRQVARGDEVRVVLTGAAAMVDVPAGATAVRMPGLQYDQLVELLDWCERAVSW